MRFIALSLVVLVLSGYDGHDASAIPRDASTSFRDGYLVQVTRAGVIEWNGQIVDDAMFKSYLRHYAALPNKAGRLWLEFEPEAPSDRSQMVRQQVIESGLCQQKRCVEGKWGTKRPVIN